MLQDAAARMQATNLKQNSGHVLNGALSRPNMMHGEHSSRCTVHEQAPW
jgi:hypothetical protein